MYSFVMSLWIKDTRLSSWVNWLFTDLFEFLGQNLLIWDGSQENLNNFITFHNAKLLKPVFGSRFLKKATKSWPNINRFDFYRAKIEASGRFCQIFEAFLENLNCTLIAILTLKSPVFVFFFHKVSYLVALDKNLVNAQWALWSKPFHTRLVKFWQKIW